MHPDALSAIAALKLVPHPEGGFYRETFRSPQGVSTPAGPRAASTAIYYLLPAGSFSTFHRVRSDEAWHHYGGAPLDLHCIDEGGGYTVTRLGPGLTEGHVPQHVVPAGVWQAAEPVGEPYTLCGCTVAPGFDFADFEMASRKALLAEFAGRPALRPIIERLTRE
jgi:predicted cupin superfamily sugar epimerase